MARLLVHVEGHTERGFVEEILREHLVARGYHSVDARFVGNSRQRGGGIKNWPSFRKGILNHLRQDTDCVSTTLVDYYALPAGAERGWPGRAESSALATAEAKGRCVEDAIMGDLSGAVDLRRFVPFVMMHEFEGLLFSDCAAFSRAVQHPELEAEFSAIRRQFATAEDINDSPDTAPSKRVRRLFPKYVKPLFGVLAARQIGLGTIRAECPHFDRWLDILEALATEFGS